MNIHCISNSNVGGKGLEGTLACADGTVLAVGNFDGLHLGHLKLLSAAKKRARELELPLAVLTFWPHPRVLFTGERQRVLTPLSEKLSRLLEFGVDQIFVARFTKQFASTTAENFVEEILMQKFAVKALFVGEEFRFGNGRMGDVDFLKQQGEALGFEVHGVSSYVYEGEKLGSSKIRTLLEEGQAAEAVKLLGRPLVLKTYLREDESLNLRAALEKYSSIASGSYWLRLQGTEGEFPAALQNGELIIRPLPNIPDIEEGFNKLELLGQIE